MNATALDIPDVLVLEPSVFEDERGMVFESFNAGQFAAATGLEVDFVQDNHSLSKQWVLRGLHYQLGHPQGKLVRVVGGTIFDVAVDVRRGSAHFGDWTGIELSAANRRQLWVPPGLAHGFVVLSETAEVVYKLTDYRFEEGERAIRWDDPGIAINWPLNGAQPILSDRDRHAPTIDEAEIPGD